MNRILSLCPSVTETLYALGLGERVVGRTRFCIHPQQEVKNALRVGGTKQIDMARVHAVQPDLVICVHEENTPEMVAELQQHYPTRVLDVRSLAEGVAMIRTLGEWTDTRPQATALADEIAALLAQPQPRSSHACAYLIWREPYMAAGKNTYIDDVLHWLGYENAAAQLNSRYPALSPEELVALSPAAVWLSSEPYPFKEKHLAELRQLLPLADIRLVDGEAFSWYGVRMRKLAALRETHAFSPNRHFS